MTADEHSPLTVAVSHRGDVCVLTVTGELDAATTAELESAIDSSGANAASVELDMAGVSFIDSSGLRTLVMARQTAEEVDRSFTITGSSKAVDRLLELTGLESLRRTA